MGLVRIHCYGCSRSVLVDDDASARGLLGSGWALVSGESYCPQCAAARGLQTPAAGADADAGHGQPPAEDALERFPFDGTIAEGRLARSLRLLRASLDVLRGDPELLVFPTVSLLASAFVGVLCFALWGPHAGEGAGARNATLVAGVIAAYPITFVSVFCGVALAAVLDARLEGRAASVGEGWRAARARLGLIAAWSLVACSVGAALRVLEERLPFGGRLLAAIVGVTWSLATLFAIPLLAYEGLGPWETVRRSSTIFKRRWGAQIGGSVGIGAAGAILILPFALVLVVGISKASGGAPLMVFGAAGMFAAIAVIGALEQIYRVFVYRSAVGLDTSAGPFAQRDLQSPFARRRGF